MNTKSNGYVTTNEASIATNHTYSPRQINKLCEVGRIKFIVESQKKLVCLNDVMQYAAAHPKERFDVVWDAIKPLKGEQFYILNGYDTKIMVSNKCRVVDMTHGSINNPTPHIDLNGNLTGYYRVTLMQNGKEKALFLHRLVGITQCDNALGKTELHHLKPINKKNMKISDHRASNLLYVYHEQHIKLHDLLSDGKTEEYNKMVQEIKKENKQKVYKIPHPDYELKTNFRYWLYLNTAGYTEYKKSGNIPNGTIVKEYAEAINE